MSARAPPVAGQECYLFCANRGFALYNSRRQIIQALLDAGKRVVVVTADDDYARRLVGIGATLVPCAVDRGGLAFASDLALAWYLWRAARRERPVVINNFHSKFVVFGTLFQRLALGRRVAIVNSITGLGHAFVVGGPSKWLAMTGYWMSQRFADAVVFQNNTDRQLFETKGWVRPQQARTILGSGVDLSRFCPNSTASRTPQPTVLLVARLLAQKGVREYIAAARTVRQTFPDAKFLIAGERDEAHPDSLSQEEVAAAVGDGTVVYLGFVSGDEIVSLLDQVWVSVLPSYREGFPRAILEASAMGVPVVAAAAPGTDEAVREGVTGFLVPVGDSRELAARIGRLLADSSLRVRMGTAGRRFVEEAFDLRAVTDRYLGLYRELREP